MLLKAWIDRFAFEGEDPEDALVHAAKRFAADETLYKKKVVRAMFGAGVPLLAGTDAGNPYSFPRFSLHDELVVMVESGVSPLGALQTAPRNAGIHGSQRQVQLRDAGENRRSAVALCRFTCRY